MTPDLSFALEEMLQELDAHELQVELVPQRWHTNEGGMVRVAVQKNAKWYRDYCARFSSSRVRRNAAPDTRIKRRDTLRILRALLGGFTRSSYAPVLFGIARARIARPSHVAKGAA